MKCYEFDLSGLIKVTMLNRQEFKVPQKHLERYTKEYIIYIIESGTLFVQSGGKNLELTQGDIYIFGKGEYQKPLASTDCSFYYVHFETDKVSEYELDNLQYFEKIQQRKKAFLCSDIFGAEQYNYIKAVLNQRIHIDDKSRLETIIGVLKNNIVSYGYNTPEWRISVSGAVASFLMRLEGLSFENCGYMGKTRLVFENVEKIADYIETHFHENFGSGDIERDLLINFDYANRIFKKNTGYSIIKYRNRLRINTAKTLISEKSLEDIALEVGFNDRYYFSRCFKKFEGISPEEYRRSLKCVKTGEG